MAAQNYSENTPSLVSHTGIALNGNVVMQNTFTAHFIRLFQHRHQRKASVDR